MIVGLIPGSVTYLIFDQRPAPSIDAASYSEGSIDVIAARYMIAFHPVSFHTLANATIGQKYPGCAKKFIGWSIICIFTRNSFTIPVPESISCKIPVTMIHERKCGRYDIVCTTFFPPFDAISLSKIANAMAVTKVTTRLITPIASVFLITRINVISENSILNLSNPTNAE